MPRESKVSIAERRDWLEQYENGVRLDELAKSAKRDSRTINTHIEKARLDRDFQAAQRDQLREALAAHQRDMLALLADLRQTVRVVPLTFLDKTGLDFGFEDLLEPSVLSRNREVDLVYLVNQTDAAVRVSRDESGPLAVILTVEESRLWSAVKEHIGKDQLWRHLANWRKGLVHELQGRAVLNRSIRNIAEGIFGLQVGSSLVSGEPRLAPAAVWWMRARLTHLALGDDVPNLEDDIRQSSTGGLESKSGRWLADHLEDTEKGVGQIGETMAAMTGSDEVRAAARSYANLQDLTSSVHDALDESLLIHHIPGRCSLCKKLGGQ